jgi:septal ring factor EnvC (AmiA/AmiB activator)
MKRTASFTFATLIVLGASVAFGVTAPTNAIDALSWAKPAPGAGRQPVIVPSSALEVDIALKKLETERKQLEEELAAADAELERIDARLFARGRTYYKQVRSGLLPAGGGFDELVDHAARVERTRLSLTRDIDSQKTLRYRRDEIADLLAHIAAAQTPLEAQKKAFASAKSVMRQADERQQAFDRAFESSTQPPDYIAIYGADLGPSDVGAEQAFLSLRGKLPLPLAGRSEVRKLEASGSSGPALELRSPAGAAARAVAAGRVVFADRHDDDRITVILDHGDHYFSMYGNLIAAEVQVGENVISGGSLGPIATKRSGAILYFELRQNGRPIEPGPWFGL